MLESEFPGTQSVNTVSVNESKFNRESLHVSFMGLQMDKTAEEKGDTYF